MKYPAKKTYKRIHSNRIWQQFSLLGGLLLYSCFSAWGQSPDSLRQALDLYFQNYHIENYRPMYPAALTQCVVDDSLQTVKVYGNETFASQPFTDRTVRTIYEDIKKILPVGMKDYRLSVYGNEVLIEELVPDIYRTRPRKERLWGELNYTGAPWVQRMSRPYNISQGLNNRHLTIWASHGRYYENERHQWGWQRPYLYCTTEDLFTQTIVVPFLIPMLENAGAVVYTPRERDWQTNECVVDNDHPQQDGTYYETTNDWKTTSFSGFAHNKDIYKDQENPFTDGTARYSRAGHSAPRSFCYWVPRIPHAGSYAVYVSYQTLEGSISDAHYTVMHQGIKTLFRVNQQMGSGTWVYLGTFRFDPDNPQKNYVALSNESGEDGFVTADAVRFGGGMGNIARNDADVTETQPYITSGLPRYLEGARYYTQWAGFPYEVYSSKGGVNDYADDINARSYSMNHLSGGSLFLPDTTGLKVPIELSLALHTDAGYRKDNQGYGSLGICTTKGNDDRKDFLNGKSRYMSYDFAHFLTDCIACEVRSLFHLEWPRRELYNRNYSETRNPEIPSAILETLAHQNFADMVLGHDPHFKFLVARAAYKAILKYLSFAHGQSYSVQPLPVRAFGMKIIGKNELELQWQPTTDTLEETAVAKEYIVYTAQGNNGFDNGVRVPNNRYSLLLQPGVTYRFKVAALNEGGESFPSETLVARLGSKKAPSILIVNAFTRLSGPAQVCTPDSLGFLLDKDPGVPYMQTPEYCGRQLLFDRHTDTYEGPSDLGFCSNELEGKMLQGNTFDYPVTHAKAMEGMPCTILSSSLEAVESDRIDLNDYALVDLIFGLQKESSDNTTEKQTHSVFSPTLQDKIHKFQNSGKGLIVSGAYIASEAQRDSTFTTSHLCYQYAGIAPKDAGDDNLVHTKNNNLSFSLSYRWGDFPYTIPTSDCLKPSPGANILCTYSNGTTAAVIKSQGHARVAALGFPFECIQDVQTRKTLMHTILKQLLNK